MQPCQPHTRDTHPTRTTFGRCPLRPGKEPSIIARRTHSAQCIIALLPNPNNKIHPNQKSQKGDKKIRRCSARSKCRSITAKGSSLTTALTLFVGDPAPPDSGQCVDCRVGIESFHLPCCRVFEHCISDLEASRYISNPARQPLPPCWVINADNIECIPSEQPHSRGSDNCAFRDEDLVIECESVVIPS